MYKALMNIGGYKKGDIVPDDKAKVWLEMYGVPHVEEVKTAPSVTKKKKVEATEDSMLDDYLGRNTGVVKRNIDKDDLSDETLQKLLKLEETGKDRWAVKKAIEKKLEGGD